MSIKVMTYVWEHSRHKGSELLTLLAIADFAHDDGTNAYPSIASLAKKTRMTERNVQFVLKKLEDSKELSIKRNAGKNGAHLFTINMNLKLPISPEELCTLCQRPGTPSRQLDKHHIIPTSWGGPDVAYNMTPLCSRCHDVIHGHLAVLRKELGSPALPFTAQALFARMGEKFSPLEWVKGFQGGEKFSDEKPRKGGVKNTTQMGANFSPDPSLDPSEEDPSGITPPTPQGEKVEYSAGFAQFWETYPATRRQAKPKCYALWKHKKLERRSAEIVAKIEALKQYNSDWKRGYVPAPLVWLNQGRYEDELYTLSHNGTSQDALEAWAREEEAKAHDTQ